MKTKFLALAVAALLPLGTALAQNTASTTGITATYSIVAPLQITSKTLLVFPDLVKPVAAAVSNQVEMLVTNGADGVNASTAIQYLAGGSSPSTVAANNDINSGTPKSTAQFGVVTVSGEPGYNYDLGGSVGASPDAGVTLTLGAAGAAGSTAYGFQTYTLPAAGTHDITFGGKLVVDNSAATGVVTTYPITLTVAYN